ncbi:hypothetical protein pb186bvf_007816 [Paramecium bursaria]
MFSQQKKIQNFDLKLSKKAMEEQKIMSNETNLDDNIIVYESYDEEEAQIKKKQEVKIGFQIKKLIIPYTKEKQKKPKKKIDTSQLKYMCEDGKSLGFQMINGRTQTFQSPKRERNVNQSLKNLSHRVKQLVGQFKNTTYNILSDRILKEVSVCSDENQNLKRRVYDSINVMIAMGVFVKHKKNISPGPAFSNDIYGDKIIDHLDKQKSDISARVQKKKALFLKMKEKEILINQLLDRNKKIYQEEIFLNTQTIPRLYFPIIMFKAQQNRTYIDSQADQVRAHSKDQIKMFGEIDMIVHIQSLKDSIYRY